MHVYTHKFIFLYVKLKFYICTHKNTDIHICVYMNVPIHTYRYIDIYFPNSSFILAKFSLHRKPLEKDWI